MTKPIARDPIYRKRAVDADIIELCVRLTRRLRDALQLVDIRVLDHHRRRRRRSQLRGIRTALIREGASAPFFCNRRSTS